MKPLPSPISEAVEAYLKMPLTRPGCLRLFANGFEGYGMTLGRIGDCTTPLMFEDAEINEGVYGIAGTAFLCRYRGNLFAITAQHCLTQQNGNDIRLALNPETKSFLPLKNLHRAISEPPDQDFADIAVLEAAPELLQAEEQKSLCSLNLDPLRLPNMEILREAKLIVPGFPKYLNEVDYDQFVIHTQRYLPSGSYGGRTDRTGVHALEFDELEQIDWPDGMSGSPVFFVEQHSGAHFFGLLGILIKAQRDGKNAEFIGADVLFHFLDKIIPANQ